MATDDCTVVLRYLPDVPITVVTGDERNMKVTEPIDVYLADKLFQLTTQNLPQPALTEDEYESALRGRNLVVFGGSYGIGADIAALAERYGARVFAFSRSSTGTHVERREDIAAAARAVLAETGSIDFVVNTAGLLPRGELADASEETVYSCHRRELPGPDLHRPGVLPAPAREPAAACCCSRRARTPAAAAATACTRPPRPPWST